MIEKELKQIISKEQYDKLKSMFIWQKDINQTNNYYKDTNNILRETKTTVRVREIDDEKFLQIKLAKTTQNSLVISNEIEEKIDSVPEILTAEKINKLTGLQTSDLVKWGSLKTHRLCFVDGTTELCLDENFYFGITDYEIEVEFQDDVSEFILQKCKDLNINFTQTPTGKYTRALKAYTN